MATQLSNDLIVGGNITFSGSLQPGISRADLVQDDLAAYSVPFSEMRIHDNLSSLLPSTAAADDLALDGETFGTDSPFVVTSDLKAASGTLYARWSFALPAEYTAAQSVRIKVKAGMLTTVSDGTATVDCSAYLSDDAGAVTGSDLVSTAAQSCNSLTQADLSFVLDASSLVVGSVIDCRLACAVSDSATSTVVKVKVGRVQMLCDVKG